MKSKTKKIILVLALLLIALVATILVNKQQKNSDSSDFKPNQNDKASKYLLYGMDNAKKDENNESAGFIANYNQSGLQLSQQTLKTYDGDTFQVNTKNQNLIMLQGYELKAFDRAQNKFIDQKFSETKDQSYFIGLNNNEISVDIDSEYNQGYVSISTADTFFDLFSLKELDIYDQFYLSNLKNDKLYMYFNAEDDDGNLVNKNLLKIEYNLRNKKYTKTILKKKFDQKIYNVFVDGYDGKYAYGDVATNSEEDFVLAKINLDKLKVDKQVDFSKQIGTVKSAQLFVNNNQVKYYAINHQNELFIINNQLKVEKKVNLNKDYDIVSTFVTRDKIYLMDTNYQILSSGLKADAFKVITQLEVDEKLDDSERSFYVIE